MGNVVNGRDLGIADRLRRGGLVVVEVEGWQGRGRATLASEPGFCFHHTAGARRGNAPSLGVCINGRGDLPGPLCNVFQARDNTIYVIASGKANHAGRGGWNGLSGNSSVYGLEVENVGDGSEPWRPDQIDVMTRVGAALLDDVERVRFACRHAEWTSRKIDTAAPPFGHELRMRTANVFEEDEMGLVTIEFPSGWQPPSRKVPRGGVWYSVDGFTWHPFASQTDKNAILAAFTHKGELDPRGLSQAQLERMRWERK